jgi:hypothetical protein
VPVPLEPPEFEPLAPSLPPSEGAPAPLDDVPPFAPSATPPPRPPGFIWPDEPGVPPKLELPPRGSAGVFGAWLLHAAATSALDATLTTK